MTRMVSALLLLAATAIAQPSGSARAFEVVSIHPVEQTGTLNMFTPSGPRLRMQGVTPWMLVLYAFKLRPDQVPQGAALEPWSEVYFDIAAKAADGTQPTEPEFREMVKALLMDRFKLQFHREQRERPVYALVVGKNGPKFKASDADAKQSFRGGMSGRVQTITASKTSMAEMAEALRNYDVDRPVVDATGLKERYDINFSATPDSQMSRKPDGLADPNEISVYTAIDKQLGLKLEARKVMMDVIIVDHVEKPTEN